MTQTPEDQSLNLHPVPAYVACRMGGPSKADEVRDAQDHLAEAPDPDRPEGGA